MPATWQTAALTFQVSPDGGTTWQELYDGAGNEITDPGGGGTVRHSAGRSVLPLAGDQHGAGSERDGGFAGDQTAGATINLVTRSEML